jgi:hypothetical protein
MKIDPETLVLKGVTECLPVLSTFLDDVDEILYKYFPCNAILKAVYFMKIGAVETKLN